MGEQFCELVFIAVMFRVALGRLGGVMRRVMRVTVRDMGVVRRRVVLARVVVLRRFVMVLRRVFVMFGGLAMMLHCVLGHVRLRGNPPRREGMTSACSVGRFRRTYQHGAVSIAYRDGGLSRLSAVPSCYVTSRGTCSTPTCGIRR